MDIMFRCRDWLAFSMLLAAVSFVETPDVCAQTDEEAINDEEEHPNEGGSPCVCDQELKKEVERLERDLEEMKKEFDRFK